MSKVTTLYLGAEVEDKLWFPVRKMVWHGEKYHTDCGGDVKGSIEIGAIFDRLRAAKADRVDSRFAIRQRRGFANELLDFNRKQLLSSPALLGIERTSIDAIEDLGR